MRHLFSCSPLFLFCLTQLFLLHSLLPAPTGSLPVLISPHPLLSPSRVFILFCGELCYDKAFTPRMYAVSACVMPLWGMGALTSSASPTRPALPKQRGLGGGAGGGWWGWLLPTPCPVLPGADGNWTHTHTRIYMRKQRKARYTLQHLIVFLFCSHE